ncbi:uncharacterized protein LOC110033035 [Phalaenopsis equestris]|uniref:uncharacterized protein LOC110033035 n=1 Tax=Phalaenopsis equestris TaxID=78828 RepID=UPI0009E5E7E3|nr:uncharacterized protein LOC110033035 [Phalaenopsis equestris]
MEARRPKERVAAGLFSNFFGGLFGEEIFPQYYAPSLRAKISGTTRRKSPAQRSFRRNPSAKRSFRRKRRIMSARTFNCRCRPSAVRSALDAIRDLLSEETINNLREIRVFNFFDMPPYPQDNVMTLHILRCWDNERGVFRMGGKEVQLHADHVAMLIGMPNRGEPVSWKRGPLSNVDARQIKNQLTNFFAEGASTPPFEELYLKFLLTNLFFPSSNFHVHAELSSFAVNVQAFSSYNWPAAICDMIIDQVRIASVKLRQNKSIGYIQGFVFLLTVNDGFLALTDDEVQLLENPEQGPPIPASQVPPHESTAGPSSPKAYARGTIVSSDITPVPRHTTESADFGVIYEMLKSQEQISLNIQQTVTGVSAQMNTVVEALSTLTGLVHRLVETKAEKFSEKTISETSKKTSSSGHQQKRKVDRPASQYQFKRRHRKVDDVDIIAPVNIDVPEPTIRNTDVPLEAGDAEEATREAQHAHMSDDTIQEDPLEVERAVKGVIEALAESTRLLTDSKKDEPQKAQLSDEEILQATEYQHLSSRSPSPDADQYAIVVRPPASTFEYPGRPFISIEMQEEIEQCLSRYKSSDVIITRGHILIHRSALEDILLDKWLADEHVDIFAVMLHETTSKRPELYRPYLYVSPMFGMHKTYGSKPYVRHITNEVVKEAKAIFFPIIHNQHWILLVLDLRLRKWRIYDSLPNQIHKAGAMEVVNMFARDAGDAFTSKINKWSLSITKNVPTQRNSFDCGMFVCKYMQTLVQRDEVDWSVHMNWQDHMQRFRAEFVYELCLFSRTAT